MRRETDAHVIHTRTHTVLHVFATLSTQQSGYDLIVYQELILAGGEQKGAMMWRFPHLALCTFLAGRESLFTNFT